MDNFINDLFDILRINTTYNSDCLPFGSNNIKCLNIMLDKGLKSGFNVCNLDNYCGYIEYGFGNDVLGILCHLDVVDVNIDKWNTNPFLPVIIDNKIYARGAQDDKGPLMACFYALKELKEEGFIPKKRVRLIMGCNEESGSLCIEHYKKLEGEPELSFSPDAEYPVIFGEKGILVIKVSGHIDSVIKEIKSGVKHNIVPDIAKVTIDKEYEYIGKSAHAMNPNLGINAISVMVNDLKNKYDDKLISLLDKYFTNDTIGLKINSVCNDDLMHDLTENVAIINYLNSNLELIIDFRIPRDECKDIIINNLGNILKDYNLNVEVLNFMPVHYVDPNSFLVKTLLDVYKKNTNDVNAKPISIGGGTYAKAFKNSVAFGTKFEFEEEVCHIDNEYVSLDNLRLNIKIIKDAIKELSK